MTGIIAPLFSSRRSTTGTSKLPNVSDWTSVAQLSRTLAAPHRLAHPQSPSAKERTK